MTESIHLAKWVALVDCASHDLLLFPSTSYRYHARLSQLRSRILMPFYSRGRLSALWGSLVGRVLLKILRLSTKPLNYEKRSRDLAMAIRRYKPDLIHSMETQHAGYLVLETKERYFKDTGFPKWLHTNWGSDIYLFGRLEAHETKIRKILSDCDFYSCECKRDIDLARRYGFTGKAFEPFPNAGGFNLDEISKMKSDLPPSKRNLIMVKGYQGWSGRGLFALRAIALSRAALKRYSIVVYSAQKNIEIGVAAELLRKDHGIDITVLESHVPVEEIWEYFSRARLYLGLGISDGISTSMLEAMAMGTFPIQSDTSSANEWIEDGITGFIVPPEDPGVVAEKIIEALENDSLVDNAVVPNWETIKLKANSSKIALQVAGLYDEIDGMAKY